MCQSEYLPKESFYLSCSEQKAFLLKILAWAVSIFGHIQRVDD